MRQEAEVKLKLCLDKFIQLTLLMPDSLSIHYFNVKPIAPIFSEELILFNHKLLSL